MTSGPGAPPLPPPPPPATAARAVSDAARAAAGAWAQPTDPAGHNRAISQLYSVLRDLGIATKGLARYQTTGHPADPAPPDFPRLLTTSAGQLLEACENLDGIPAAEGLRTLPNPEEPGAVLCQAARTAIPAWRQPAGTSADRDTTVEQLITALAFLATGTRHLTAYAPRRRAISLNAAAASLAEVTACLAEAIQPPARQPRPKGAR